MFLNVSKLVKKYQDTDVLNDVSFSINKQEILGIIGPSGSGKSTLLKCLALLEVSDYGTIEYENKIFISYKNGNIYVNGNTHVTHDIDQLYYFRKNIGFVFQGFNLWEEKTVLQNLILAPCKVLKESKDSAIKRARDMCRKFDISDKLDVHAWELSGGQRQRVAIIRALLMNPEIMLLDEITSALDPILTHNVMTAILKLREEGYTMIVVTHHLEFASNLCDRILFLENGKIIQDDTPKDMRNNPVNNNVKKFLEILKNTR